MDIKVEMRGRAYSVDWTPALDAMGMALSLVQDTWESAVSGNKLAGMTRTVNDENYANSLRRPSAVHVDSIMHGYVSTDYQRADSIEDGAPPWDMKPGLINGPHAKAKGKYTIVPFRHGTPGTTGTHFPAMPNDVYGMAKQLAYRNHPERGKDSSLGNMSAWHPPQVKMNIIPIASSADKSLTYLSYRPYKWTTSKFSNMVRAGTKNHTQYLTFRTVSVNSPANSWWYPATPPNPVRESVVSQVRTEVEDILRLGWIASFSWQ